MNLKSYINEFEDFPTKGVLFRDISPILKDYTAWNKVLTALKNECLKTKPNVIAGIESRGFIIGSALSTILNIGFVSLRKKGKLPGELIGIDYSLEYGNDRLEIQKNILSNKDKVFIVDDLLATGGTASASIKLIEKTNAKIVGIGFIVQLKSLKGKNKINGNIPITSVINYD